MTGALGTKEMEDKVWAPMVDGKVLRRLMSIILTHPILIPATGSPTTKDSDISITKGSSWWKEVDLKLSKGAGSTVTSWYS